MTLSFTTFCKSAFLTHRLHVLFKCGLATSFSWAKKIPSTLGFTHFQISQLGHSSHHWSTYASIKRSYNDNTPNNQILSNYVTFDENTSFNRLDFQTNGPEIQSNEIHTQRFRKNKISCKSQLLLPSCRYNYITVVHESLNQSSNFQSVNRWPLLKPLSPPSNITGYN